MVADLLDEIEKLRGLAGESGVYVHEITPDEVVVFQWVRFKCRYGCKGYGKHFGCPPYARHTVGSSVWLGNIPPAFSCASMACRDTGRSARTISPRTSTHGTAISSAG